MKNYLRTTLIVFFLFFKTQALVAQQIDSTIYYKLKEIDSTTTVYYSRTFYSSNHIKEEGWVKLEKPDTKFVKLGTHNPEDTLYHKCGVWKYYYKNGFPKVITEFPLNDGDSIHQKSFNKKNQLTYECTLIKQFPERATWDVITRFTSPAYRTEKYYKDEKLYAIKNWIKDFYPDGKWVYFDTEGKVIKEEIYSHGKLLSETKH